MRKKIGIFFAVCTAICITTSCAIGCGKVEVQNSVSEEAKDENGETYIDGFEKADYERFNSYASENGLGDTPIYIEGKVLNQTKTDEDSSLPMLSLVVEQEDGNRWVASAIYDSEIDGIEDKNVRIFGTYTGFSDIFNLPAMAIATEDKENYDKARIEEEKNGEYVEIWNFYDDCLNSGSENKDDEKSDKQKDDKGKEAQNATLGQSNALVSAKNYLDITAFSKKGLIEQLEYEGYTSEEANYAADHCGADWSEQAKEKAKSYLDIMSFSKEGLIEQLEYEGFTHEQAVYGAEQNGY